MKKYFLVRAAAIVISISIVFMHVPNPFQRNINNSPFTFSNPYPDIIIIE